MRLKTDRLLIRSIQPGDAEPLAKLWADSRVTRYLGGPRSYESLVKLFQQDAKAEQSLAIDLWLVIERASQRMVGHSGLLEKEVDGRPDRRLKIWFY